LKKTDTLSKTQIKQLESSIKDIFKANFINLTKLEGLNPEQAKELVTQEIKKRFNNRYGQNFKLEGPDTSNRLKQHWFQIMGQEIASYIEDKTEIKKNDSKI